MTAPTGRKWAEDTLARLLAFLVGGLGLMMLAPHFGQHVGYWECVAIEVWAQIALTGVRNFD